MEILRSSLPPLVYLGVQGPHRGRPGRVALLYAPAYYSGPL